MGKDAERLQGGTGSRVGHPVELDTKRVDLGSGWTATYKGVLVSVRKCDGKRHAFFKFVRKCDGERHAFLWLITFAAGTSCFTKNEARAFARRVLDDTDEQGLVRPWAVRGEGCTGHTRTSERFHRGAFNHLLFLSSS